MNPRLKAVVTKVSAVIGGLAIALVIININNIANRPKDDDTLPQSKVEPVDDKWYVLRHINATTSSGARNECAVSEMTPAQLMAAAREDGIKYDLVDDVAQSRDGKAHAVAITLTENGVEHSVWFFRGREFCLFSAKSLTGSPAVDAAAYR